MWLLGNGGWWLPTALATSMSYIRCGAASKETPRIAHDCRASGDVIDCCGTATPAIDTCATIVGGDKTFCIYISDSEELIQEHAERSGFPATKVTAVRKMIDPVTAEPD